MTDCPRGPTARRVWEVDPLNAGEDPVLRALGFLVAGFAYQKPATFHFEPWLKHESSVFLQEVDEIHEVMLMPFPDKMASAFQPLIKDICQIDRNVDGATCEGSGVLFVREHEFALNAKALPSPWGQRVLLFANREGAPLPDPCPELPWFREIFDSMTDTSIDFTEQPVAPNNLARAKAQAKACVQWAKRFALRQPVPPQECRFELLCDAHNHANDMLRLLINKLREATGRGITQVRLVTSDDEVDCYQYGGRYDTGWKCNGSWSLNRSTERLRRVIADLGSRYPVAVAVEEGTAGIALAVGGHPLDATIKENRVQGVVWDEVPSDIKENISRTATVFDIIIHDDSPDPPHWERNRRLAEAERSLGEEPPSELECSVLILSHEYIGDQPPHRSWLGWIRSRLGGTGRAEAGDMTLEDAQDVASLLKARDYAKALTLALPFKSGGPVVAMGVVPSCVVGLLELLLGRNRQARASICDYQKHTGEDLVSMLLLAECCERLGDTVGEQEAMRRASELLSQAVSNLVANGTLLEEHGFLKQAVFLYESQLMEGAIYTHGELALENERKYRPCRRAADPQRLAWRYAQIAAEHAVAADGIDTYLMPTEYGFAQEKKTREHGGLYWHELEQPDGRRVRQYFPNYLNRFADNFRADPTAVRKLGPLLKQMGRADEATVFLFEADLL